MNIYFKTNLQGFTSCGARFFFADFLPLLSEVLDGGLATKPTICKNKIGMNSNTTTFLCQLNIHVERILQKNSNIYYLHVLSVIRGKRIAIIAQKLQQIPLADVKLE